MTGSSQGNKPWKRAIKEGSEQLTNAEDSPFSQNAFSLLKKKIAEHISQFLDIEVNQYVQILRYVTYQWEQEGSITFEYLQTAAPQERLQVSVKFLEAVYQLLVPFLMHPEEDHELRDQLEKSVAFYFNKFASR